MLDARAQSVRRAAAELRHIPVAEWPEAAGPLIALLMEKIAEEHEAMHRNAAYVEVSDREEAARLRRGPGCLRYAVLAAEKILAAPARPASAPKPSPSRSLNPAWVSRRLFGATGVRPYRFDSRAGYVVKKVDEHCVSVFHVEPYGADSGPARPEKYRQYALALENLGYEVELAEDGSHLLVTKAP